MIMNHESTRRLLPEFLGKVMDRWKKKLKKVYCCLDDSIYWQDWDGTFSLRCKSDLQAGSPTIMEEILIDSDE